MRARLAGAHGRDREPASGAAQAVILLFTGEASSGASPVFVPAAGTGPRSVRVRPLAARA